MSQLIKHDSNCTFQSLEHSMTPGVRPFDQPRMTVRCVTCGAATVVYVTPMPRSPNYYDAQLTRDFLLNAPLVGF